MAEFKMSAAQKPAALLVDPRTVLLADIDIDGK